MCTFTGNNYWREMLKCFVDNQEDSDFWVNLFQKRHYPEWTKKTAPKIYEPFVQRGKKVNQYDFIDKKGTLINFILADEGRREGNEKENQKTGRGLWVEDLIIIAHSPHLNIAAFGRSLKIQEQFLKPWHLIILVSKLKFNDTNSMKFGFNEKKNY